MLLVIIQRNDTKLLNLPTTMAAPNPFDASLLGTHEVSLRLELGVMITTHCCNSLLGPLGTLPISPCGNACWLGPTGTVGLRPALLRGSWAIPIGLGADFPTFFGNAVSILNVVYGRNWQHSALSPTFLALIAAMEATIPQNAGVVALRAAADALPNPITEASLRTMDGPIDQVLQASDNAWSQIYGRFGLRQARCCMMALRRSATAGL